MGCQQLQCGERLKGTGLQGEASGGVLAGKNNVALEDSETVAIGGIKMKPRKHWLGQDGG